MTTTPFPAPGFDLAGKVAVVTGGGQGLGRGVAEAFLGAGASVAVLDVDPRTSGLVEAVGDAGRVHGCRVDIRDGADLDAAVVEVRERFGCIDAWVNNAGGWAGTEAAPFLATDPADFDPVVELNLRGTFLASQVAARAMVDQGHGGAIVNVCSLQGVRASPHQVAYGAAKAAVAHLTQTVALELAPHDIRVNAVAPSFVETPAAAARVSPERRAATLRAIPLARVATPADVAGMIVVLASDLARFMTGQLVVLDGGLSLTTARPHRGQGQD